MKSFRPILFALCLVSGFYLYTTSHFAPPALRNAVDNVSRPSKVEVTEAATPQEKLDSEEQNNIEVYRRVLPAVVNITSRIVQYDFFYGPVPVEGQCSGFLIDKQGHIVTNFHCLQGLSSARNGSLKVTLNSSPDRENPVKQAAKKSYDARIVGTDSSHDLAVIQISAPDQLPTVTLGDSKLLQVGQKVYAIGNPFGLSGTMSRGIISSLRPVQTPNGANIDEAIQTDAAINPGNSGGPLLNSHGDVIGVNTMIATNGVEQSAGIGFAIPINTVKAVIGDLVTVGHVRRPALGVRSFPVGPELAQELGLAADSGLMVVQVVDGSGAQKAGIRGGTERAYIGNTQILLGGDLIVAVDGKDVQDSNSLANILNEHRAGDTVKVTLYRGKRKMDVDVTLTEAQQS